MPPACDPNSPTCATAKTSPYAFLSTVVYPDCGPDCPKLPIIIARLDALVDPGLRHAAVR